MIVVALFQLKIFYSIKFPENLSYQAIVQSGTVPLHIQKNQHMWK